MKKTVIIVTALIVGLFLIRTSFAAQAKNKILYIDSYHQEYIWSADIADGIKSVLDDREDVLLKKTPYFECNSLLHSLVWHNLLQALYGKLCQPQCGLVEYTKGIK